MSILLTKLNFNTWRQENDKILWKGVHYKKWDIYIYFFADELIFPPKAECQFSNMGMALFSQRRFKIKQNRKTLMTELMSE